MAGCGFQEYPKWVGDVVVQNEAEDRAQLAAIAALTCPAEATQTPPLRSPAAVRMRRSRERRRDGKRTILCDILADQIEALALAGFIDPAKRDDAAEGARGVGRLVEGLTRSGRGTLTDSGGERKPPAMPYGQCRKRGGVSTGALHRRGVGTDAAVHHTPKPEGYREVHLHARPLRRRCTLIRLHSGPR
jgi:hypothetical protein